MDASTARFYEDNAQDIATRYESVGSPVAKYFPLAFVPGARLLDIGAGSGRDLAHLLKSGYEAYGVEPTDGLRAAAKVAHPELENRLASAALPELGMPFDGKFDGILCSAVLMHVPDHQLFDAALAIRALLNPHGRLLLSLPLTRGDNLVEQRDTSGRLFQGYTAEEIQLLFERLGFQCIGRWDSDDALARAGTSWYTLLLELRTTGTLRAIDQIEGVLNRGEAVNALKRAIYTGRISPAQAKRVDEMQAVADALSLMANIVMAWNTSQMQAVLDRWSNRRQVIPPELIGKIAPTRLESINLRGVFRFPVDRYADQILPSRPNASITGTNG